MLVSSVEIIHLQNSYIVLFKKYLCDWKKPPCPSDMLFAETFLIPVIVDVTEKLPSECMVTGLLFRKLSSTGGFLNWSDMLVKTILENTIIYHANYICKAISLNFCNDN